MSSEKGSGASNRGLLALNKRLKTQLLEARRAHAKEVEQLRSEFSAGDVNKLEVRLESAKKLAAASKSKLDDLQQQLDELHTTMEQERQEYGQERATLQEKISSLTTDLMSLRATSITNSMSYHAARESLDRTLNDLESEREEYETETAASQELLVFLEAQVASQEEQLTLLGIRRDDLEKLRNQLQEKLATSEESRSKIAEEYRVLKAKATSRVRHLEAVNSELKDRLREDNLELDRVREKFADFLDGMEEDDKATSSLKDTIGQQNEELTKLREELEQEKSNAFEARQKTLEAHNQLESATETADKLKEQLKQERQQAQTATEKLQELEADLTSTRRKCEQFEEQLDAYQSTATKGSLSKFLGRIRGE